MIKIMNLYRYFRFWWLVLRVQEIDKTIRGKADIPASFPAVKGTGGNNITSYD